MQHDWHDPHSEVMVTPTEVLEYLFCPRFVYFMNVLKIAQREEKRFAVQKGRKVHEDRLQRNKEYLRTKIPVNRKELDVYLASPEIGVRGVVDEILFLDDGSCAPIDYKYSEYREYVFLSHKVQLCLYGFLIEKIYMQPVSKGFISYVRKGSKTLEVPLTSSLREQTLEAVAEVLEIIKTETMPKMTRDKAKCIDCTYKNICV
jgi:CRISPR-associated exonuclease Cas4